MKTGAKIFGVLAGILILFLGIGLLLPGTWHAEASARFPVPASRVFPFMDQADQWIRWNPMPESGAEFLDPASGPGAGLVWDDPQYGTGRFEILSSEPLTSMVYEVSIEDGALEIRGTIRLTEDASGTRLEWREEGDFGWNPLMGYTARRMGESQSEAMGAALEALRILVQNPPGGR